MAARSSPGGWGNRGGRCWGYGGRAPWRPGACASRTGQPRSSWRTVAIERAAHGVQLAGGMRSLGRPLAIALVALIVVLPYVRALSHVLAAPQLEHEQRPQALAVVGAAFGVLGEHALDRRAP